MPTWRARLTTSRRWSACASWPLPRRCRRQGFRSSSRSNCRQPPRTKMSLLTEREWRTSYRHEDGDLIELFYNPALTCAVQYDRMTGYFSADALALAARGIAALITNDGRMRLIVGCT